MKPTLQYIKGSKGFMLGYTMFFAAMVLAVVTAFVYLIPSRQASTRFVSKYSTKAHHLAESGMQHALSQIRENAITRKGLATIEEVSNESNKRYDYRYRVLLSTITLPLLSDRIIVSATSYGMITLKSLNKTTTRYVHALIEANTLVDYFEISTKNLKIGRGLDLSNADVYGYNLTFLDGGSGTTKVNKADYFANVTNDTQAWVEIGGIPGAGAYKCRHSIDLPRLPDVIDWYSDLASKTTHYNDTNGLLDDINCTNGYTSTLSGHIYPPLNGNGVYYSPGPITIGTQGVDTVIHGQMIFITTDTITIEGNIIKSCDGIDSDGDGYADADSDSNGWIDEFDSWDARYQVTFASIPVPCSLVGLLSGQNIYVDVRDGSNKALDVKIESTIFVSEGLFGTHALVQPNWSASFDFKGSLMFRDDILFAGDYSDPVKRTYMYDEDLRRYGLPHMPFQANILYYYAG